MIWQSRQAATKIQALWRRSLVRTALYDPYKEGWVKRFNLELSDRPYYLNTITKEVAWQRPIAYVYFGERSVSAVDHLYATGFHQSSTF